MEWGLFPKIRRRDGASGIDIELVQNWGFHEYFDPYKAKGYGTDDFSWTAALCIDAATEGLKENQGF